jgi:hypothetical protein
MAKNTASIATKSSDFMLVSQSPDVCLTRVGKDWVPIPYTISHTMDKSANVSPNVYSEGMEAFLHGESFVKDAIGDEPGKKGGVVSGVQNQISFSIDKSKDTYINGKKMVRTGDSMWMNQAPVAEKASFLGGVGAFLGEAYDYIENGVKEGYKDVTDFHFEGREALNSDLPSYEEAIGKDSEWQLLPEEMSIFHDDGIGKPELKFIHPDGREAVFNGDTLKLVTDPRYVGTYNYVTPTTKPSSLGWGNVGEWIDFGVKGAGHVITDVLPYGLGGNVRGPN